MRVQFLKNTISVLLIGLMLGLPVKGIAKSGKEFPYHMPEALKNEITFDYSFEDVWTIALKVMEEIENMKLKDMQEQGLESVKADMKSDKKSGLIMLKLSHKGKNGLFSEKESLFYYQVLLIKNVKEKRTFVYSHEINFFSYDKDVFLGKQFARVVDYTVPVKKVLKEINIKLNDLSDEN